MSGREPLAAAQRGGAGDGGPSVGRALAVRGTGLESKAGAYPCPGPGPRGGTQGQPPALGQEGLTEGQPSTLGGRRVTPGAAAHASAGRVSWRAVVGVWRAKGSSCYPGLTRSIATPAHASRFVAKSPLDTISLATASKVGCTTRSCNCDCTTPVADRSAPLGSLTRSQSYGLQIANCCDVISAVS